LAAPVGVHGIEREVTVPVARKEDLRLVTAVVTAADRGESGEKAGDQDGEQPALQAGSVEPIP
jgi:hypothetical protein